MSKRNIMDKIEDDFKRAYLQKEREKASVLSLLKSALKNAQIAQRGKGLDDQQVHKVVRREIKERRETISELTKAGRDDQEKIAVEQKAIKFLEAYLPAQVSPAEIEELARKAIAKVDAQSPQDMGRVMGILMPQLAGRADGKQVSKIVQRLLAA